MKIFLGYGENGCWNYLIIARNCRGLSVLMGCQYCNTKKSGVIFFIISTAGAQTPRGRTKLFVFGDSYADTGNNADLSQNNSAFREPFGMTWPGRPAGRASDGYCLTDIIANFLKQAAPPTYKRWLRHPAGPVQLRYGMNFAYGGSGALPAWEKVTLGIQIDAFENVLEKKVFTKNDVENSVGLISIVGNDISHFLYGEHGPIEKLGDQLKKVRDQLVFNIKRLQFLGIRKFIVNTIYPKTCDPAVPVCRKHNQLFLQEVEKLRKNSTIVVLNYETLVDTAIAQYNSAIRDPQKPCCQPQPGYFCGNVDKNGKKLYTVCDHPELAFIFNEGHISHDGWKRIYSLLLKSKTLDPLLVSQFKFNLPKARNKVAGFI